METRVEHNARLNRVFEYIELNLDSDLTLKKLADVACFSPFHFHRIFRAITGETLNEFITRQRVEKSAIDLIHSHAPVTEITLKNGFSCNSAFTRTFRKFYGVSPSEFRRSNPNKYSKIRQLKSKNGQVYPDPEKYLRIIEQLNTWTTMNASIDIRKISTMHLAYITVIGPQNLSAAFGRLMQWATVNGLMHDGSKLLTIYHDSLKITPEEQVRMSACLSLDAPVSVTGEIGLTTIDSGNFVVGSYKIPLEEFERAWTGLFLWMNEHGHKRADGNPFEIYHNNFNEHPEKKCIVDFYIPVG